MQRRNRNQRQNNRRQGRRRPQNARNLGSAARIPQYIIPKPGLNHLGTPYNLRLNMPYVYTWANATGAPGFFDWVLRGNGLFDPDTSIGGNSAYQLNELHTLYSYYKVLGSSISVDIVNLDTTNPLQVAIIPTPYSSGFAAAQQDGVIVHPRSRRMMVDRYNGVKRLSHRMSTNEALNVRDIDDIGFQAACTADPTHQWYWHVVTWNNGGAAANCEIKLTITFDAIFFGPKAGTI